MPGSCPTYYVLMHRRKTPDTDQLWTRPMLVADLKTMERRLIRWMIACSVVIVGAITAIDKLT